MKDVKKPSFIFDSYALLAFLQGEAGGEQVRDILKKALSDQAKVFVSVINLGEIYYIVARKKGRQVAQDVLEDMIKLPLEILDARTERVLAAADVKARSPLSYADAFVAAAAMEFSATIVTGDSEFRAVETRCTVLWI